MSNQELDIKELIHLGTEITGQAAGAAIGAILAGPPGAAIGGAIGATITKSMQLVLRDVTDTNLSHREKIRLGATAIYATQQIKIKLDAGYQLRQDDIFSPSSGMYSNAQEVFEGVLLKSKQEHESKKVKLLANIFANFAFSQEIDAGEANNYIHMADSMSYRQMCLLALFHRKGEVPHIKLRPKEYRGIENTVAKRDISILQEICQLGQQGLLGHLDTDNENYVAMLDWTDAAPDRMRLTDLGQRYFSMLGLDEIATDDLETIAKSLAEAPTSSPQ